MHELLVDALNELTEIETETGKLAEALSMVRANPDSFSETMGWLAVQGLASAIEKIYSGYERMFSLLAKQVDQLPIEKTEAWHRSLLLRMSHPFGDIRPAVLSPASQEVIDTLRAFRHRQRHSYGSALDFERVLELAEEAIAAPKLLRQDLEKLAIALRFRA